VRSVTGSIVRDHWNIAPLGNGKTSVPHRRDCPGLGINTVKTSDLGVVPKSSPLLVKAMPMISVSAPVIVATCVGAPVFISREYRTLPTVDQRFPSGPKARSIIVSSPVSPIRVSGPSL
jgi:hypothetical protein